MVKRCSAEKLAKFYWGTKPSDPEKRTTNLPKKHAEECHKNALKNLRAAINRHIQDLGLNIDLVHEFKEANSVLDGMLKERMQNTMSRPTQHKPISQFISAHVTWNFIITWRFVSVCN